MRWENSDFESNGHVWTSKFHWAGQFLHSFSLYLPIQSICSPLIHVLAHHSYCCEVKTFNCYYYRWAYHKPLTMAHGPSTVDKGLMELYQSVIFLLNLAHWTFRLLVLVGSHFPLDLIVFIQWTSVKNLLNMMKHWRSPSNQNGQPKWEEVFNLIVVSEIVGRWPKVCSGFRCLFEIHLKLNLHHFDNSFYTASNQP